MAGNPGITVLITRPMPQADRFAAWLHQRFAGDVHVVLSPLLKIVPIRTTIDLTGVDYLLFTSANGVRAVRGLTARRDIPVLCVGEKTADLARQSGFGVLAAEQTVAALLECASSFGPGKTFLYLRGKYTAAQVVRTLNQFGNVTSELIVYEQLSCELNLESQQTISSGKRVVLPLFSPRTAAVFQRLSPGLDLQNTIAICISRNTADNLDSGRFHSVIIAHEPTAAAIKQEIAAII